VSKQFPHVHSFRLSDEDEGNLTALMRRFKIDFSREQSSAFRCFLKRLSHYFSELDSDGEERMHSAAHWQPGAMESQEFDEDEESEWHKKMNIVQKNYHKVERLTYEALRKERLPFTQGNIDRKFQKIKKKLGLITSAHEIDQLETGT